MRKTIEETERRRTLQLEYNDKHGIVPKQIDKGIRTMLPTNNNAQKEPATEERKSTPYTVYEERERFAMVADPIVQRMTRAQLEKTIDNTKELMKQAAKDLDFLQAAQYRDEIIRLQSLLDNETAGQN